jgi:hypothetical protein
LATTDLLTGAGQWAGVFCFGAYFSARRSDFPVRDHRLSVPDKAGINPAVTTNQANLAG